MKRVPLPLLTGLASFVMALPASAALIGYGVTANGTLFSFDPDSTATSTTIGNLGIVPEGIDFRPAGGTTGSPVLYAVDVGPVNTQIYRVNVSSGAITPVGAGFATTVAGSYTLGGNQTFGFDFNPRTLQADGSVRIRLVASGGANLRLNSDTGGIAAVDTALANAAGGTPHVDAAAYLNTSVSTAAAGGSTTLYVMDSTANTLNIVNPPNNGTVNAAIGMFGVTIDANPGMAFDIYSDPLVNDDTIAGDRGFSAFTRTGTAGGAYLLYDVNLANGATTGGRLVASGLDFTGGLAIIPEPSTALLGLLGLGLFTRRRSHAA